MKLTINNTKSCNKCVHAELLGNEPNCVCTDSLIYNNFKKDGKHCASYCKVYKEADKVARIGMIEQSLALNYILAGKSEFILHSLKTEQDFKFAITRKKSNNPNSEFIYFINEIKGKTQSYEYAGFLLFDNNSQKFKFMKGAKGSANETDLSIRSIIFVLNKLFRGEEVGYLEVYHTGKCGYCGKKLTTPESVLTGLGPTCSKRLGVPRMKVKQ